MPNTKLGGIYWNFASSWNLTLNSISDKPLVPRDYIWASELGGAYCDRYLRMYGVKYTNPPNTRSQRKFQAGNLWEWVVGILLLSAGMIQKKQVRVETKLPKMLTVSGKIDFVAGGHIDWSVAKSNIQKVHEGLTLLDIDVPPFFVQAIDKFVDEFMGAPLKEVILEIKSVSSFISEIIEKRKTPQPNHRLQAFHYVNGNNLGINEGKIIYICKDDCIMHEFAVYNDDATAEQYKDDVRKMTKYYNAGFNKKNPKELMPPLEPLVLFEEGVWKFNRNYKVEYSPYLNMLYGYETPEAYRMAWQRKIASWNRVFKRCVRGDRITDKNKEVISEASKMFPLWDKYVALAKKENAFGEETDDEE